MFHTDATRVRHFRLYHHTTRSLLTTAITAGTLLAFLMTFVVHLTLAWSNGQAAALVLGQPNFTTSDSGISATMMSSPAGVAIDLSSGKVFMADAHNNRVLRFASVGSLSNGNAAEAVLGQPDFGSSAKATTAIGMYYPTNIAVDGSGRLWVVDVNNNRVLRFDNAASKTNGAMADGVLGHPDFVTSAHVAAAANNFAQPRGVAVDNSGNLWVSDSYYNRVLRFNNAAGKPNGASADGVLGQTSFTTGGNGLSQNSFNQPFGVAADSSGHLWIADSVNNRVLRFDNAAGKSNGANADGVLGQPDFVSKAVATTQNGLNLPAGLVVDSSSNLWVADTSNNRALYFINKDAVTATPTPTNMLTSTPINTVPRPAPVPRRRPLRRSILSGSSAVDHSICGCTTLLVAVTSTPPSIRRARICRLSVTGQARITTASACTIVALVASRCVTLSPPDHRMSSSCSAIRTIRRSAGAGSLRRLTRASVCTVPATASCT